MTLTIGVPKESRPFEYRVGMTPAGVSILTAMGHQCYVETEAGLGAGFRDTEFEKAGARIAFSAEEVFRRADLLLKVQRPTLEETEWMANDQTLLALLFLATTQGSRIEIFRQKNINAIAYELIQDDNGIFPVLYPLSQIGGRMTAQIAAHYLQNNQEGNGILLGGITGVPPAEVVILGAGVVGANAIRAFLGMSARVIVFDRDLQRLQVVQETFGNQITTMVSHDFNLRRVCTFADVLVGAIQTPGQRAEQIITREMVQSMRPGSLIIDLSIDQGGCVETSRPTRHDQPTFVAEDVIHYCVRNVPGVVARTATHAFLNAAWPFIKLLAKEGLDTALDKSAALKRGIVMRDGKLITKN